MLFPTRGHFLGQVSYMGDRSNMTKSGIKQDKSELPSPTQTNLSYEKRLKLAIAKDDEPNGIFGDVMSEFKRNIKRSYSHVRQPSWPAPSKGSLGSWP